MDQSSRIKIKIPGRIMKASEKIAKWQESLKKKNLKAAKIGNNADTNGPHQPIVITHLSPSRCGRRPNNDVLYINKKIEIYPSYKQSI